jgi:hypothetical protein
VYQSVNKDAENSAFSAQNPPQNGRFHVFLDDFSARNNSTGLSAKMRTVRLIGWSLETLG